MIFINTDTTHIIQVQVVQSDKYGTLFVQVFIYAYSIAYICLQGKMTCTEKYVVQLITSIFTSTFVYKVLYTYAGNVAYIPS